MKITVKQLKRAIMETIKEQIATPATGTPEQIASVTAVLQSIMNYAAAIYGGRRGYLPALSTKDRRQIDTLERSILNFGNTATTGLDALASIPYATSVIPGVRRTMQAAQEEIRRMQGEIRGADLASLDLAVYGNRLRTIREQVIDGAFSPIAVIRNRLRGISSRPARPAVAPDVRNFISSFSSGVASALAPAPSAEDASFSSLISNLAAAPSPSTTLATRATGRPSAEERTIATTAGLGTLRPTTTPGPVALPAPEETAPRGTIPTIREAALRHLIKQEVKKYLR